MSNLTIVKSQTLASWWPRIRALISPGKARTRRMGRPDHATHRIVAGPSTGLGNRLRCVASLLRIARRIGAEFVLDWPVNDAFPAPFDDLYLEPLARLDNRRPGAEGPKPRGEIDPHTVYFEPGCKQRVITTTHLRSPVIHACAERLYLMEESVGRLEAREEAIAETGRVLAGFRLNPYVAAQLHRLSRQLEIDRCIGIHVRRGDAPSNRRVEVSRVAETLSAKHPEARMFVASDDEAVLANFQKRFGGRVVVFEARSRCRTDRTAGQDALIELLLLSRTRRMIAGYSSFAQVAAMVGGIELEELPAG